MGIDISSLSPWAQKQIAQKIARQAVSRADSAAQEKAEKRGKYHNIPTERMAPDGDQIKFKSKAEARRYDELMLMLHAGSIRDLRLQPQFTLQEAYTTPEGKRIRAIRYTADFSYEHLSAGVIGQEGGATWIKIVEDVKGGKATKTKDYAMRKKMMRNKFGIDIVEVVY